MRVVSECLSPYFAARIMFVLSLFARSFSQNIGDVRLVDRGGAVGVSAGRVEVYSDLGPGSATWARLCEAGWNSDVASVVCRQLGFDGVQRFYSSLAPRRPKSIIRLNRCNSNTDATSLNEAGCQQSPTACKGRRRDASVDCLVRPSTPMQPQDNKNPTPVIVTTSTVQVQTTPTTTLSTTSEATSTVSTILTITSTTASVDVVTSDLMTTDSYITLDRLPRKDLNVAAIYIGVTLSCFIIAIILIIIFLCYWCKRKITNTKQTGRTGGGSDDREHNFQNNEYQYNGVRTVENGPRISSNISGEEYQYSPIGPPNNGTDVIPRVPKQDSVDEYQYTAVGPMQNGTDVNPRVPKQDSVDEYQYSAVGPMQNGTDVNPRVPKQDSVDEYQYSAVGPMQNGTDVNPRVPKQDSVDEYQYSAVGPMQNGTDVNPRVPKQDSVDEYQYSAVGPMQNGTDVNPRVPKQDSVDKYQYSAVGPIQNGADVNPSVPTQDSGEDEFYSPVGAISSDTLTPKATAFSNVCTDESFYTIPDRSEVNPYQELAVKTSAFAGLQKLRKKPALEQNTQRAPEIKVAKQPPVKPKKSQTPTNDTPVQISGKPHLPTEVDNIVYGLEVLGEQNACAASSLADGQTDDQCESIYAVDIELREISPSGTSVAIYRDYSINRGIKITDGENPYENSIIGDQSFLQDDDESDYHALSRKATLPV
ncbi:uncharacterized protein LOC105439961 [Strongylocentrotus purpuratus]|uniref:SRCR domain-containing protein n=1 Tax=Strongylocentrotus purpuratus TaxID=7668 RepID=A0A7M7HKR5_STRPU|nr:uncharacterized protein LOC105439961 [Strongylocentrotus purpuratus]|eukprot:XP_011667835.1 PREDICTED: uncharacterized protein LOC105439961 [Strongylocentrotus purpuratus]